MLFEEISTFSVYDVIEELIRSKNPFSTSVLLEFTETLLSSILFSTPIPDFVNNSSMVINNNVVMKHINLYNHSKEYAI